MLALLLFAMLPVWWVDGNLLASVSSGELSDFGDMIDHFSRRLLSNWLLPAMGFMLALRCGAVDLSIWAVAGLGGLVSAALFGAGFGAWTSISGGIVAGAGCGAINGALVARLRIPGPIVTGVMSLALILTLRTIYPGREVVLETGALDGLLGGFQFLAGYLGLPSFTLQSASSFLVFALYALTMIVILNGEIVERNREQRFSERRRLFASLTASGALAAAGGALWLVEHGAAPVPARPFDDLMIPAAALLAGGLYLAGSGRTLLVGVLLPLALAAVSGWRQEVLSLRSDYLVGYQLQVIVLVVMVSSARYAMTCATMALRWRGGALALAWFSSLGIGVFATSVWAESAGARMLFHVSGGCLWLGGALGAIVIRLAWTQRADQEMQ